LASSRFNTKITKMAKHTKARRRRAANPKHKVAMIRRAQRAVGLLGDLGVLRVGIFRA
jgi:hypothetical protein